MAHKKIRPSYEDAPIVSRAEARASGLMAYFDGKRCRNGHLSPRLVSSGACRICNAEAALAWQKRMYLEQPDEIRTRQRDKRVKNPSHYLFRGIRARAAKKGIEFSITASDITIPEACPCCLNKIQIKDRGNSKQGPLKHSPSVDRVDPSKGYTRDNIAVICWRCNELKRNASVEELRTILRWMEKPELKPALKLVS